LNFLQSRQIATFYESIIFDHFEKLSFFPAGGVSQVSVTAKRKTGFGPRDCGQPRELKLERFAPM